MKSQYKFSWTPVWLSAFIAFGAFFLQRIFTHVDPLVTGKAAGLQFQASDAAYLASMSIMGISSWVSTFIAVTAAVLLAVVWLTEIRRYFMATAIALGAITAAAFMLVASPQPASAYYDQQDYTEPAFILPNESAFWIPNVGDNKSSQASLDSEDYLQANKIAAKLFIIPHMKLAGSGAWYNFYVPSGRLIIVDRTQYSREWVKDAHRGTSTRDESFPCQSSEGIDIKVGIAVGASVDPANAAKFLYRFGVKAPSGDRTDPKVIFTGVYYGRSLTEVMDGPVRSKIQSLVCDEFTKRTFVQGNTEANAIMADIEKNTVAYLKVVGITLDYIGWADTFTFSPIVQDAVDRAYVATQDAIIAGKLAAVAPIIQSLALSDALRNKWDGKLPASVSVWGNPIDLFKSVAPALAPAK